MKTKNVLLIALIYVYITPCFAQPGTLDSTFSDNGIIRKQNGDARAVIIEPDGKIILAGNNGGGFTVVRYTGSGDVDKSFGKNKNGQVVAFPNLYTDDDGWYFSYAYAVVTEADGKIIAAGDKTSASDFDDNFAIAKFNTNGTFDTSFGNKGKVVTDFFNWNDQARCILIQPDNKIVVAGTAQYDFLHKRFGLARYNPDGSLDKSFNGDGKIAKQLNENGADGACCAILQQDGKIVVIGTSWVGVPNVSESANCALMRVTRNGNVDSSFGTKGYTFTSLGYKHDVSATSLAWQSNGKIIVGGVESDATGIPKAIVMRYTPNGRLDSSFGTTEVLSQIIVLSGTLELRR